MNKSLLMISKKITHLLTRFEFDQIRIFRENSISCLCCRCDLETRTKYDVTGMTE